MSLFSVKPNMNLREKKCQLNKLYIHTVTFHDSNIMSSVHIASISIIVVPTYYRFIYLVINDKLRNRLNFKPARVTLSHRDSLEMFC